MVKNDQASEASAKRQADLALPAQASLNDGYGMDTGNGPVLTLAASPEPIDFFYL